jgi:hypothetical protein
MDYYRNEEPPNTSRGVNLVAHPPGGLQPPPVVMAVATPVDPVIELTQKLALAIFSGNNEAAITSLTGLMAQWPRPLLTIRQTRDAAEISKVILLKHARLLPHLRSNDVYHDRHVICQI